MGITESSVKKSTFPKGGRSCCFTVKLERGRLYRFEGKDIGTFTMKGGACGNFTVNNNKGSGEQCNLMISDEMGNIVLSKGYFSGDSITIQDNPADGTSSVEYTRFGKLEVDHPIPIRPRPSEIINLMGKRDFVISGSGAHLICGGTGNVTVYGIVQTLKQTGCCTIKIRGSVSGKIVQKCEKGRLIIEGNVTANLTQRGSSLIEIRGTVFGKIKQKGDGELRVWGKHRGKLHRRGKGRVVIDNREVGGVEY